MSQAAAGFPWFIVGVFVIGFVPGVCLLIVGRRGRRIDDHPVCRGCGFDLVGTVEPIPDKYPKCPECGTRREPRLGNRKRRGKLIVAGIVLMFLSVGVGGVWGYGRFDAAHVAQYKPMWLLRWEAQSSSFDTADIALGEIITRLRHGRLATTTAELLLDDAVANGPAGQPHLVHASIGSRWDALAAELLLGGYGTPAERETIGRSWITTRVEVRPLVRLGASVPIRFVQQEFGPDFGSGLYAYLDHPLVEINGHRDQLGISSSTQLSAMRSGGTTSSGWTGTSMRTGSDLPDDLGLGEHEVRVHMPIRITDGRHGATLAQWTDIVPVRSEYVDPQGDAIKMIHNPALAAQVEQAVQLRDRELVVNTYGINAMLDWSSIPVDFAYQLYAEAVDPQDGAQTAKISTIAATQKVGDHGFGLGGEVPEEWPDGTVVDLVFEPSPDVARTTPDIHAILDHAFKIEGVKIVRPNQP
ncbi:MAG: hypothetical protein AAF593_07525 [Planctomycetota bacterium]